MRAEAAKQPGEARQSAQKLDEPYPFGIYSNKYRFLVIDSGGSAVRWRRSEANTEEAFGGLDHLGVERPRLERDVLRRRSAMTRSAASLP